MYPRVKINLEKYRHNVEFMQNLCHKHHLTMMAVTKVFCADQKLIDVLNEVGVDFIADSRLINLKAMHTDIPKVLLRVPSIHEVEDVIEHTHVSLNSEIETIGALNKAAQKKGTRHKIVMMIDIGDLREGMFHKENIVEAVQEIQRFDHIELYGIGTNLTCYGGIIPNEKSLSKLVDVIELIKQTLNVEFAMVSGGNSSHIHLLLDGNQSPNITNLRLGEALVLGRETAYGNQLDHMHSDVIVLEADLIEIKHKPSIPDGDIGMNAFGITPSFKDYGLMKRGILAIGRQDVDYHELIVLDESVRLIGSSSDHIIVDLTHAKQDYKIGDTITFRLSYGSVLSLMTSRYVEKIYV